MIKGVVALFSEESVPVKTSSNNPSWGEALPRLVA